MLARLLLDIASQITRSFNTSSANIGNHTTNVYAAPINGLKNHTKYSCRAIVNNTTGTLKGEEITFVTGNTVKALTNYIYTNYKSHTKPKVKNIVVCNDNSGNKMSIINEGDIQMMDLSVNKISPEMKVGEISYFSITLRNKGGVDINNVKVKLSLDKGVTLVNSNDWHIDRSSDNTFTNSIDTLYKGSEKTYIVKQEININNGVPMSSAISNVTATYEVNTNKGVMSNEASAFAMYQVINNKAPEINNKDLETKTKTENTKSDKDKTDKDKTLGQYIDSLSAIEIISILIIIALIIFLSNNIYKAVNKKRREKRSIHTVTEEYKH